VLQRLHGLVLLPIAVAIDYPYLWMLSSVCDVMSRSMPGMVAVFAACAARRI